MTGDIPPTVAQLYNVANEMRSLEHGEQLTKRERLSKYRRLRAKLEKLLTEIDGTELPDDHHLADAED